MPARKLGLFATLLFISPSLASTGQNASDEDLTSRITRAKAILDGVDQSQGEPQTVAPRMKLEDGRIAGFWSSWNNWRNISWNNWNNWNNWSNWSKWNNWSNVVWNKWNNWSKATWNNWSKVTHPVWNNWSNVSVPAPRATPPAATREAPRAAAPAPPAGHVTPPAAATSSAPSHLQPPALPPPVAHAPATPPRSPTASHLQPPALPPPVAHVTPAAPQSPAASHLQPPALPPPVAKSTTAPAATAHSYAPSNGAGTYGCSTITGGGFSGGSSGPCQTSGTNMSGGSRSPDMQYVETILRNPSLSKDQIISFAKSLLEHKERHLRLNIGTAIILQSLAHDPDLPDAQRQKIAEAIQQLLPQNPNDGPPDNGGAPDNSGPPATGPSNATPANGPPTNSDQPYVAGTPDQPGGSPQPDQQAAAPPMFGDPPANRQEQCERIASDYVNGQLGMLADELGGPEKPIPDDCMPAVVALQQKAIGSDWDEIEKAKKAMEQGDFSRPDVSATPTTHLEAVPLQSDPK